MKLLKLFAILGLSSVFAVSAMAVENPQAAKSQPKAQQTKSQPKQQKQAQKKDTLLEQFNKTVGIRFVERGMRPDDKGNPLVTLTYTVENKGKRAIKSVNWVSAYRVEDQDFFYIQNIPVEFNPALGPEQKINITVNVPYENMPKEAQPLFANRDAKINAVNGAKNIVFSNGKRLVVAK